MQYEIKTREKSKELLYGAMIAATDEITHFSRKEKRSKSVSESRSFYVR
jgi:hypothetical protein